MSKQPALRDVTNKFNSSTSSTASSSSFMVNPKCDDSFVSELDRSFESITSCKKPKRLKPDSFENHHQESFSLLGRLTSQLQAMTNQDDELPVSDSDDSDVSISSANSSITFQSSSSRLPPSSPLTTLNIISQPHPDESSEEYSLRTIQSCLSMSMSQRHDVIMQSLEIEHSMDDEGTNKRLIGDKTRHHSLPTLAAHSTKHTDLNCISPATLKSLLDGEFDATIGRFVIFDSRYPYEFAGGHIRGALNVYTKEELYDWCFERRDEKPVVIIFHCEFSSERGPNMLRFLRSQDRAKNKEVYPHLFYPELYLLDGGYKSFFEKHPDYCEPRGYKPMLHQDHVQDLKHFRAKTKTWEMNNRGAAANHNHHSSAVKLETRFKKPSKLHRCPRSTLF